MSLVNIDLAVIIGSPFSEDHALQAASMGVPFVYIPLLSAVHSDCIMERKVFQLFEQHGVQEHSPLLHSALQQLRTDMDASLVPIENCFALRHAARVIASNKAEKLALQETMGTEGMLEYVSMQHIGLLPVLEPSQAASSPPEDKLPLLQVGPLTPSSNQLMLLEALRNSALTVTFAILPGSDPKYEHLCRAFQRQGTTRFITVDSLGQLMNLHKSYETIVAPNWYEPLNNLYQVLSEKFDRVILSNRRQLIDASDDAGTLCDPANPEHIRKCIEMSLKSPIQTPSLADDTAREAFLSLLEVALQTNQDNRREAATEMMLRDVIKRIFRACALNIEEPEGLLGVLGHLPVERLERSDALLVRGVILLRLGRLTEAMQALTKAKDHNPFRQPSLYFFLGLGRLYQGEFSEADAVLSECLEYFSNLQDQQTDLLYEYRERARNQRATSNSSEASSELKTNLLDWFKSRIWDV
ncbi:MAG: hypothetical protein KDD70_11465 [Bdellovibrionales bacterium]|nr:hypothetical protein [Bdellovibrionales bacterium]